MFIVELFCFKFRKFILIIFFQLSETPFSEDEKRISLFSDFIDFQFVQIDDEHLKINQIHFV